MPKMHKASTLLIALAVLFALQTPLQFLSGESLDGLMVGPDSFMRLHRVAELHNTASWYDTHDPHINAPIGHALHWTRPFDVLLYTGAWIASAFTDFRSALWLSGLAISPLLMIGVMLIWSRTTRPYLDDRAFLIGVVLFGFLPLLNGAFRLGRADHHSLLLLLFFTQLAIFVRYTRAETRTREMAIAGALCGMALWVSVESLTHVLVFCTVIGLTWLAQGGRQARDMAIYLAAATAIATVALIAERSPEHWLDIQYDRISIVHWTLLFSGTLGWVTVYLADRSTRFSLDKPRRILFAVAGCAVPGVVIAALFPTFFAGPFAEVQSAGLKDLLSSVQEFQPLLPVDRYTGSMFIGNLGPALLALAYIAWRWPRADAKERSLTVLWLVGLAVFTPLALFQALRWASYAQAVIWLPWSLSIFSILRGKTAIGLKRGSAFVRPALTILAIGAPVAIATVMLPVSIRAEGPARGSAEGCDWRSVGNYLARSGPDKKGILITHFFAGSEIVWRAGYRIVGAPYNIPDAFEDTRAFFGATTDSQAQKIAVRRKLALVLVCPIGKESKLYRTTGRNTLFQRLGRGEPPSWLVPSPLPNYLSAFHLYRVVRP